MNLPTDNKCQRCGKNGGCTSMSIFNTQMICMGCQTTERAHPKFPEARDIELNELQKGNYNFPGIGLPPDLQCIKEVT